MRESTQPIRLMLHVRRAEVTETCLRGMHVGVSKCEHVPSLAAFTPTPMKAAVAAPQNAPQVSPLALTQTQEVSTA